MSQPAANDKLAPRERIELRVWRWTALQGGLLEGLQLNHTFSIDAAGQLELPNIGSIAAAGLRPDELAKLIADRLQARSGLPERASTSVQRVVEPPVETTGSVDRNQTELDAPAIAATEDSAPVVTSKRTDIDKGQGSAQPSAPGSQALADSGQTPLGDAKDLRRELSAARAELDVMQRGARGASAQAHATADIAAKQAQSLKEQQQTTEALAQDLAAAQRVIEGFNAKAAVWDSEKAATLGARQSMEASQATAKQALDAERSKVELLQQQLTAARKTIDDLKTSANLAAVEQANAVKARQVAEAASKQAGEALDQERARADSAVRNLDGVRKERDALQQASAQLNAALQQERERANGLARSLSAARETIVLVKAKRRTAAVERAPKARNPASQVASALSGSGAKPARNPALPVKQKVKVQKAPQAVQVATIVLPASLLPTRPPKKLDPSQ